MIASVAFRNFRALRATSVALGPFNIVIGPNGSGKTSLIEVLLRLGELARHATAGAPPVPAADAPASARHHRDAAPEIGFVLASQPGVVVRMIRGADRRRDHVVLDPPDGHLWSEIQPLLADTRGYVLDHAAMARTAPRRGGMHLNSDGGNLAAVLAGMRQRSPASFSALTAEMLRITPEFHSLELAEHADGRVEFGLRLADDGLVPAAEMSQGMLYLLAMLALAFDPNPPRLLCIEDVDRGIHPRMLREVRDALYRLSHPQASGLRRAPVQVIATTHSPYFLDLFREHPEEVILSQKQGRAARFERLSDRPDLPELLREGSLGDMWYSGILGGVPDDA
ncbi:MAG TPA: AAA family ATPase [Opitutaceae bacterium]|nr:AAA family ATPase [Opitutaceae bacterium]